MDGRCERHNFEAAVDVCDHCGEEFCAECLVHPFGEKKPPLCIPCTIANSGLRAGNAKPKRKKLSRKERKALAASGGAPAPAPAPASSMPAPVPVVAADDGEASTEGKRSKRGRRKDKGKDVAAEEQPSVVPSPAPAPAPAPAPVAEDAGDRDDTAIPTGAGMPAKGADQIDWSKPFEFNS